MVEAICLFQRSLKDKMKRGGQSDLYYSIVCVSYFGSSTTCGQSLPMVYNTVSKNPWLRIFLLYLIIKKTFQKIWFRDLAPPRQKFYLEKSFKKLIKYYSRKIRNIYDKTKANITFLVSTFWFFQGLYRLNVIQKIISNFKNVSWNIFLRFWAKSKIFFFHFDL